MPPPVPRRSVPEDPALIGRIEEYGNNDVVVVLVWANLDQAQFDDGEWVR